MCTNSLIDSRQVTRHLEQDIVLTTNRQGGTGGDESGRSWRSSLSAQPFAVFLTGSCPHRPRKPLHVLCSFSWSSSWTSIVRSQGFPLRKGRAPKQPVPTFLQNVAMGPKNYAIEKIYKPTSLSSSEGIPQEVRVCVVYSMVALRWTVAIFFWPCLSLRRQMSETESLQIIPKPNVNFALRPDSLTSLFTCGIVIQILAVRILNSYNRNQVGESIPSNSCR